MSALSREERLERKLARARKERDRWQARYRHMVRLYQGLDRRRNWTERYLGFRIEYRLRGMVRRVRRWYWQMKAAVRGAG